MREKTPTPSHILNDQRLKDTAQLFHALNTKWAPHSGQIEIGEAIFAQGARRIFLECGRKWGKSEFAVDLCWRLGNMMKDSQIYYYGAYAKAVREFIWSPGRLQNHGPTEYVKEIHKTEMRITFHTNTFVKCDGADEFRVSKGYNPDVVILDEFADYPEDFWIAMSPNFASKDAIVLIITSPPWMLESEPGKPVICCRIADLWAKYENEAKAAGKRSKYKYLNHPTHINPHISKEWLKQEEEELREMGLDDVWEREYLGRRVIGGGKRIIPTFKPEHIRPHEEIMAEIEKDLNILQWASIADPSQSAFGVLLMAVNPYSKDVYFLDEILEKEDAETTEQALWPRIQEKEDELYPPEKAMDEDRFLRTADEAAKWWIVGCASDPEINVHYNPTEKHLHSKEFGLSLLRAIFKSGRGHVSDRCKWLAWQMENYKRDKRGQIPKKNDDLIDCGRYGLHSLAYFLSPEEIKQKRVLHLREQQKANHRSLEEDMLELARDLDRSGDFFSHCETEGSGWQH